jgi:hypothetical protein
MVNTAGANTAHGNVVGGDVNTGPGASYTGLRESLEALRSQGASFGDLPVRHASEWAELFPAQASPGTTPLEEIALAPSERRLHRESDESGESEQVCRVLSVAAAALCAATALLVSGVGGTDLSSLRGFMRAVEHARVAPGAVLLFEAPEVVRAPVAGPADYSHERLCCLRRMGLPLLEGDLVRGLPDQPATSFVPVSEEGELYLRARNEQSSAVDRVAAAWHTAAGRSSP